MFPKSTVQLKLVNSNKLIRLLLLEKKIICLQNINKKQTKSLCFDHCVHHYFTHIGKITHLRKIVVKRAHARLTLVSQMYL